MTRTLDQKLAELDAKRIRLIERKRKEDTRQKIIIGSLILSEAESTPDAAAKLLRLIGTKVTREVDQTALAPVVAKLEEAARRG